MGQQPLDPHQLLADLNADHQALRWEPLPPTDSNHAPVPVPIRARDGLEYLHRHWALPDAMTEDGGPGLKGRLVRGFGRLTFRALGRYLREERDLLAHMVQVSEALERRCDQLTDQCRELAGAMIDRQVAEAENLAVLAAWLHAEPVRPAGPASAPPGTDRPGGHRPDDEDLSAGP